MGNYLKLFIWACVVTPLLVICTPLFKALDWYNEETVTEFIWVNHWAEGRRLRGYCE